MYDVTESEGFGGLNMNDRVCLFLFLFLKELLKRVGVLDPVVWESSLCINRGANGWE